VKKDSLYLAARWSYLLDDPKNSLNPIDSNLFIRSFLLSSDKNGYVRSIIDGLKKDEIAEMEVEIDKLLKED